MRYDYAFWYLLGSVLTSFVMALFAERERLAKEKTDYYIRQAFERGYDHCFLHWQSLQQPTPEPMTTEDKLIDVMHRMSRDDTRRAGMHPAHGAPYGRPANEVENARDVIDTWGDRAVVDDALMNDLMDDATAMHEQFMRGIREDLRQGFGKDRAPEVTPFMADGRNYPKPPTKRLWPWRKVWWLIQWDRLVWWWERKA